MTIENHSKEWFSVFIEQNDLPSIDPILFAFITIYDKSSEKYESAMAEIEFTIEAAWRFTNEYSEYSKQFLNNFTHNFEIKDPIQCPEDIIFCFKEIDRLQEELFEFTEQYFSECLATLSQLNCFLISCKEKNIAASISLNHLREYMELMYRGNVDFYHKSLKYESLKKFFERQIKFPKLPTIPLKHLQVCARDVARTVNEQLEYCLPSFFDDLLYLYIVTNNEMNPIDQAVQEAIDNKTDNEIKLDQASVLIIRLIKNFQPSTLQEIVVYRTSLMRILFDKLYLKYELPEDQEQNQKFIDSCNRVSKMTPRQLEMVEKFIKEEDRDTPIKDIFSNNEIINDSWMCLSEIHFYTNPLDILNSVFNSMKECEKYMFQNAEGVIDTATDSISFDDFFSIYIGIVAVQPPANAVTIMHYLKLMTGFKISSHMSYASVVFTSVIENLIEMKFIENTTEQ